jgi:hypothetical protein
MLGDTVSSSREVDPMIVRLLVVCVILVSVMYGCTTPGRVTTTSSPGVDEIPTTIAVYPLLANEAKPTTWKGRITYESTSIKSREDKIYIVPPSQTKLLMTPQSEIMTGVLSSELSYYGFKLKALPFEVLSNVDDSGGEEHTVVVSLATIRHLRENYGLQALLIGNTYFMIDRYDPTDIVVKAVYLKLVDAETLDVLCQVTLLYEEYGDMEEAASEVALELARQANLTDK